MKNFFRHLHVVNKHRFLVFIHCCKLGIWYRGLFHDLSKYNPKEFFRSVKYFNGSYSPIINERRDNLLYSKVFIHHTRRNKHHFEYYIDEYRGDIVLSKMPYKILLEYVADTISASKTYNGKNFKNYMPKKYYEVVSQRILMHSMNIEFVKVLLDEYSKSEFKNLKRKNTKKIYNLLNEKYSDTELVRIYSANNKLIKTPITNELVQELMN